MIFFLGNYPASVLQLITSNYPASVLQLITSNYPASVLQLITSNYPASVLQLKTNVSELTVYPIIRVGQRVSPETLVFNF